jgi:hemoglobin-like flavoprotein
MITERQILLVKNSWCCAIDAEKAGKLFYGRLFEVAPGVRHLFPGDIKFQSRKLMNMVALIVTRLHKLDEIMDEVKSLARRHNRYGAEPAHYQVVGECLLWTLGKVLGDKWNDETCDAWTAVYSEIADAMIKGQAGAVAA